VELGITAVELMPVKELFNRTSSLIRLRKRWTRFRRADFPAYATQAFNGGTHVGAQNDGAYTYTFEGSAVGAPRRPSRNRHPRKSPRPQRNPS
jgi:pullulanase/glycogen debranching enzyme